MPPLVFNFYYVLLDSWAQQFNALRGINQTGVVDPFLYLNRAANHHQQERFPQSIGYYIDPAMLAPEEVVTSAAQTQLHGCIKFQTTLYSPPSQFLKSWFSSPKLSSFSLLPAWYSSQTALILWGRWYCSPFFPRYILIHSHDISSPLHNLIFFPNRLDNPPPRGVE